MCCVHRESYIKSSSCNHTYHTDCIVQGIEYYVRNHDARFLSCLVDGCAGELSIDSVISLFGSSSSSFRIQLQKSLLSHVLKVVFCPSCGLGVKEAPRSSFGACFYCKKSMCFSCGKSAHFGDSCDIRSAKLLSYKAALSFGREVGLCPHCENLIEKNEGCNAMRCGCNADDNITVPSSRGCGKHFDWNARKALPVFLDAVSDHDEKIEDNCVVLSLIEAQERIIC
ncbi:MAG: IBR domain-containing protein [Oligoflexales bacterium]